MALGFERNRIWLSAFLVCVIWAGAAPAAEILYTVDSMQSMLTASGTFGGTPIQGQPVSALGSTDNPPPTYNTLVTSYSGTITADRELGANTVQFTGGNITAENSGPYEGPFNSPPPAQYGFLGEIPYYSLSEDTFGPFNGAVRGFCFSITSPIVSSANSFDVSQLSGSINSGEVDFFFSFSTLGSSIGVESSMPITGGLAFASENATLTDEAGVETITLPIDTDLSADITDTPYLEDLPVDIHLSGSIVATATLPEPASLVLIQA